MTKNKKHNRFYWGLAMFALLMTGSSCKKFLSDYSQDMVSVETVADLDELLLGSAYLPSVEYKSFVSASNVCPWLNFLDDDVNSVKGTKPSFRGGWDPWIYSYIYGYTTWQQDVTKTYEKANGQADDKTWKNLYNKINVLNIILEEVATVQTPTATERMAAVRIEGEARFLRAQYYFILTNLYGDAYEPATAASKQAVPLKLTPFVEHQGGATLQFPRATVAELYSQITADLNRAAACLDQVAPSAKIYRASKEAAQLLLSRVYLYMQDWQGADAMASAMLLTKGTLHNMLSIKEDEVAVNENNKEVLFAQGGLSLQTVMTGFSDDFCVSRDLYDSYSDSDARKQVYFGIHATTDSVFLDDKYRKGTHRSYVSDVFMLRTAEAYLNKAEAAAMLGKDHEANEALLALRKYRLQDAELQQHSAAALLQDIREERRRELCFEGHRWFDLKRYAVNGTYPFSKNIVRVFTVFNQSSKDWIQTEIYHLPANDPAYTFNIPQSVREFESGMIGNERNVRPYAYLEKK